MPLKPWYKIEGLAPREDLRQGKPLDAAEFAVHLDQVRDKRAPQDYQNPESFFSRTYLTQYLTELASQTLRRLSGEVTQTSAVFNLSTQFGGGKTHALTLLYHLAKHGRAANNWAGVSKILAKAGISSVPEAAIAVFVGTEFDSTTGRDGRKTPWGEIAYQLGGNEAYAVVAEHDRQFIEPKGDVIRQLLPKDKPCLILMDEILNYASTYRQIGYGDRLYNFIQALSETARGQKNVVLVVSIPASEIEYTAPDEADQQRFKKMLDRLGKAITISADSETSEIIRRRLFESDPRALTAEGKTLLPKDALATCDEYAEWMLDHRQQIPKWFPIDSAREVFAATYPFHPSVLSVFERKWQALPRFQRTRGILRLLALWVSKTYREGYKGNSGDALITLGSAPLEDADFRTAIFEQMGEERLEAAVTTDICGKKDAHALRLDAEAEEEIKRSRLHRQVAATIFFESNGGCTRTEATVPEIRLAAGRPNLNIGNVETVLEALTAECYYLTINKNRYKFGIHPNLNKILADRRASVKSEDIDKCVGDAVKKLFARQRGGIQIVHFPKKSGDLANQPTLTLVVLSPERSKQDKETVAFVESIIREVGASARTYKSALIFAVPDSDARLRSDARQFLAWQAIQDEEGSNLDESQKQQLELNLKRAERDLKESVWRTYKYVLLLGKNNKIRIVDLGLVTSSAAESLPQLIINQLRQEGDIEEKISPRFLVRNWSDAFEEWSTKSVRDTFFASPKFPRLLQPDAVKEAIALGVRNGNLAYVGKVGDRYDPFEFKTNFADCDVEISEDTYIIKGEVAEAYLQRITDPPRLEAIALSPETVRLQPGTKQTFTARGKDQRNDDFPLTDIQWSATVGEIDSNGVLTVPEDIGNFIVTAAVGEISANTNFSVVPAVPATKVGEKQADYRVPPEVVPQQLQWSGEITPQKWMNFYTRVLSKFNNNADFNLKIEVSFSIEGDITKQHLQETKAALEELGLNGDLEAP
jgi:hypothetical protein